MSAGSARVFVGLMSGTSLDGVDAVAADFSRPRVRLLGAYHHPFAPALRRELMALQAPGVNEVERTAMAANRLSETYAASVRALLQAQGVAPAAVAAVGCHGQTIRHRPARGYTVQIGNPALLAERLGLTVVGDFRSRDVAAGGQGAPLVPAFHDRVFRSGAVHRVILNIGGIANLTDLPPGGPARGFDCGPGNLLMDAWIGRHRGRRFDRDGAWAAGGQVDRRLLARLLRHGFLRRAPPKSTGRDDFHLDWLDGQLAAGLAPRDVQATLLAFSVEAIARALADHCPGAQEIYACGGGARNRALMDALARRLAPMRVAATDDLGVAAEWVEGAAFAWLARQALLGQPGNLPDVTGAAGPRILGAVWRA